MIEPWQWLVAGLISMVIGPPITLRWLAWLSGTAFGRRWMRRP